MIFDSHCHYNLDPFAADWARHWQQAQAKDVQKSMVIGTNVATSRLATQIAQQPNLWASIAIHPIEYQEAVLAMETPPTDLAVWLNQQITENLTQLTALALSASKIVAIGETGLDYFHLNQLSLFDEQKTQIKSAQQKSLTSHLKLAEKLQLPIILHVRDQQETAYWDTLATLEKVRFSGAFVLHCVSGSMAYVQKALEMGAYIGVAGNVTYKNAEHIRDLVRSTPKERILIETDAPYLPPQAFRGQTCEPWMISLTSTFLETELEIPAQVTWQNAHRFFGLE